MTSPEKACAAAAVHLVWLIRILYIKFIIDVVPHQGPVWPHLNILVKITGVLAVSARYLLGVS